MTRFYINKIRFLKGWMMNLYKTIIIGGKSILHGKSPIKALKNIETMEKAQLEASKLKFQQTFVPRLKEVLNDDEFCNTINLGLHESNKK
jgi:hypothetical protein